jgi:hypothetical protein
MPGTKIVDMALFKEFPLARAEAFNVSNHPQFGDVDTGLGDGSFGKISNLAQNLGA